jgi:hypothetical protein
MENLEWHPFFYNGIETNIEVTKCGHIKKVQKEWYGFGSGSYKIKYGEVDFNNLKKNKNGYIQLSVKVKGSYSKSILIHQLIAAAFLDYKFQGHKLVVDHIDSNKLNNHIDNLRIVTARENVSKEKAIKSGLPTGVCYYKSTKKYHSRIEINKKTIRLGCFKTIEEASYAYQQKLKTIK